MLAALASVLGLGFAFGTAVATDAKAEGRYELAEVLAVNADKTRPAQWEKKGAEINVRFDHAFGSASCIGQYHVRFMFDRDPDVIPDDVRFSVRMRKVVALSPPCAGKGTRANVYGANNFPLPRHPRVPQGYGYNGNIEVVGGTPLSLWDGTVPETSVTVQVKTKRHEPYTKLTLAAGENALHMIYRYVEAASEPVASQSAATPAEPPSRWEEGTNRPGLDFRNFDQAQADPGICEAACNEDTQCLAWTWVRPGLQGPVSRCWLKYDVPQAVKSDCCVSGIR